MKRTPEGDAFTEVVTRALLVGALLEKAGDALAAPEGQSAARWKVLGIISKEASTVAEIARSLGLARQGIQRIADALTKEGLTQYLDNPADRRADLLALTTRGQSTLSAIQARQRRWANDLAKRLDVRELTAMSACLQKLASVLAGSERSADKR